MCVRARQCMHTAGRKHAAQRMQPKHKRGPEVTRTLFRMTVRAARKSFGTQRSASVSPKLHPLGRWGARSAGKLLRMTSLHNSPETTTSTGGSWQLPGIQTMALPAAHWLLCPAIALCSIGLPVATGSTEG